MNNPFSAENRGGRRGVTRLLIALGVVVVVVGLAWGMHYWLVGRFRESTDDAYLQADNAIIDPQVSGTVTELKVSDNQPVKTGDILLRLDDRTYKARVAQSEADVASAQADLDNATAQIARQQSAIAQAEAQSQFASADAARYATLVKEGAASEQLVQKSRSESKGSSAALETARKQLDIEKAQREKAQATLQHAQAALDQDRINLADTTVVAPVDGVIGDRSVELGQYVQAGARLMTIVPVQAVYVVANFKETQTAKMVRGAKAIVSIDAYPGTDFTGTVDSLAPGTGAQFALLPPENATGNFTKIVQRVPVKIIFDRDNKHLDDLRPGLSATVTIDTRKP